jgi:protein-S-isoprenylcysteine O-methyltransferase Ste14
LVVGGWWLVVGGWWLVVGGWWLVVGGWWLVAVTARSATHDQARFLRAQYAKFRKRASLPNDDDEVSHLPFFSVV